MAFTTVLNAANTILVVNTQEVRVSYYKVVEAQSQFKQQADQAEATLKQMDEARQAEIAKLDPIREKMSNPVLTPAGKQALEAEATPIVQAAQQIEQNMRSFQSQEQQKLQANAQQLAAVHNKEILAVVDEVAKAKKADFVIEKGVCYFSNDAADITAEVIAKLNANQAK
ncbi:MAG: OmpH family outer membrane protein [Opitutales bacterium]